MSNRIWQASCSILPPPLSFSYFFLFFLFVYSVKGTCSTMGFSHILSWRYYLNECLVIGVNHGFCLFKFFRFCKFFLFILAGVPG